VSKFVYHFGDGKADGQAQMKNLLGGKGRPREESEKNDSSA